MGLLGSSAPMPKEGDLAPDFTLLDQNGKKTALSALKGKRVVLYFYPRADTPGCTAESCAFRDEAPSLPKDVVVVGVSKDTVEAQKEFAKKYGLTFPLLADAKGEVIEKWGVGGLFGVAKRVTFLIGADGKVAKVWPIVNPLTHAASVAKALAEG
jgi:peroxiredoxin Q/BCP